VTHVIHTYLNFETILRQHLGAVHNAGVVDKNVKFILLLLEAVKIYILNIYFLNLKSENLPICEVSYGLHGAQIQFTRENIVIVSRLDDLLSCLLALSHIATGHIYGGSPASQFQHGLLANSLVASSHNHNSASLIRFLGELATLHILPEEGQKL